MGQTDLLRTQVLVIGGGVTGAGVMRDLALRGVYCLLVEKRDVNAGASGGNHGLLHSGARYACADPASAAECRAEGAILKRLAPQCVEDCGGLFVAVEGDGEDYVAAFAQACGRAGIPAEVLTPAQARDLEPVLSPRVTAAFAVPDASVDPFKLTLETIAHARSLTGCDLLRATRVERFEVRAGRIRRVHCRQEATGRELVIEADQVVNCAGAWAGRVAALAGADLAMSLASGTLLVTNERLARRVLNRLRPPGDGDILVPGGTVSILGTTSQSIRDPDLCRPTAAEAEANIREASAMIPALARTRFVRAYAGVRPLLSGGGDQAGASGRNLGRGFALIDHAAEGLENFCTITGGKLTTFRLMAQAAADLAAARLGLDAPCRTAEVPLPDADACAWTEPGRAPRFWAAHPEERGPLLCECEMIPARALDEVLDSCGERDEDVSLMALGVRSRLGKGACQGAFCGLRVAAHLHDRDLFAPGQGLARLRDFLSERFKGQAPVLWGGQLRQAELAEALHCGLLNLELEP